MRIIFFLLLFIGCCYPEAKYIERKNVNKLNNNKEYDEIKIAIGKKDSVIFKGFYLGMNKKDYRTWSKKNKIKRDSIWLCGYGFEVISEFSKSKLYSFKLRRFYQNSIRVKNSKKAQAIYTVDIRFFKMMQKLLEIEYGRACKYSNHEIIWLTKEMKIIMKDIPSDYSFGTTIITNDHVFYIEFTNLDDFQCQDIDSQNYIHENIDTPKIIIKYDK